MRKIVVLIAAVLVTVATINVGAKSVTSVKSSNAAAVSRLQAAEEAASK